MSAEYNGVQLTLATVLSNYNREKPGLVKLRLSDSEEAVLDDVKVLSPSAGNNYGVFWLPEVGEQVLVGFLNGNADRPVVLGSLYTASDEMLKQYSNEKNELKSIVTAAGTRVELRKQKGKEQITVKMPKHLTAVMDEDTQKVTVTAEKVRLTLDGKNGSALLEADKELVLKAGRAKITLKESGSIEISGEKLMLSGGSSVELKSNGSLTLKGQNSALSGSITEVKSSGMLTLKGSLTKIN